MAKKQKQQEIAAAIQTVVAFVRWNPGIVIHKRSDRSLDPLDKRNAALRELLAVYLEYHFRRTFPPKTPKQLQSFVRIAESERSDRMMKLLEYAHETHEALIRGE